MTALEAHLFVERLELTERFEWADAGEFVVHSSRSPAKDTQNEDAALLLHLGDGRTVLAVADGVGGRPAGEQAARLTLEALLAAVREQLASAEPSLPDALLSGFDRANQSVLALGSGCATTLAAVAVDGGRMRAYHVGDAGVLAFGGRGKLKLKTIAHSPVGYGVEAGYIREEDALAHEDSHFVSNVVGDEDMHIGVSSPLALSQRDSLVLASDGLFDNLTVEAVVEALRSGPLEKSVSELVAACRARMQDGGHADDLTLIAHRPPRRAERP